MQSGALAFAAMVFLASQNAGLVDQFSAADRYARMQLIADVAMGKRPASEAEVRELLLTGMKDSDASVRAQAVGSVGAILAFAATPKVPAEMEWTVRLRPVAESLRPELETALKDPDGRVRADALRAILWPIFGMFGTTPNPVLPEPRAVQLAGIFEKDPSPSVRALALEALVQAHPNGNAEVRRLATQVLLRAFGENDQTIVQAAGIAVRRVRIPEALPLLVQQLKNPSRNARLSVAQGIAAYGEAARQYLPELQAALAAESDDVTRKTIAGTISVITKSPRSPAVR
jgi:HEAT repeat protein